MVTPISINLAVEDLLSEALLRKIINESRKPFYIGYCYGKSGYGYLKQKIKAFNHAARITPFFVLADLVTQCAPIQKREWIGEEIHPNLLFRVAVRESEAWLLADREGFASFLGINYLRIPSNADEIQDPKNFLLNLARRSRNRELREAILPSPNTTASVGPSYNSELTNFVQRSWVVKRAIQNSDSLLRAFNAIRQFNPIFSREG